MCPTQYTSDAYTYAYVPLCVYTKYRMRRRWWRRTRRRRVSGAVLLTDIGSQFEGPYPAEDIVGKRLGELHVVSELERNAFR